MALKNENQVLQTERTFSVSKDVLYPYLTTGNSELVKSKDSTFEQTVLNSSKSIAGIEPMAIKKIEEQLKLTFLIEKDAESLVCMANNPEVRDENKDIFDLKNLLDYSYAVVHSPNYIEKDRDISKIDLFQVPYPNDTSHFWKLVNLGEKLRNFNLSEVTSAEKQNDEKDKILKEISEIIIEWNL